MADSTSRYSVASKHPQLWVSHRNLTFLPRRFERELEALRKELADSSNNNNGSRSGRSSPTFTDGESLAGTPLLMVQPLPANSLDELLAEAESSDKDKEQ